MGGCARGEIGRLMLRELGLERSAHEEGHKLKNLARGDAL